MNCKVVGVKIDQVVDEGENNLIIGTIAHKQGPHSIPFRNFDLAPVHHRLLR
jgi:hypothetical protein